MMYPPFTVRMPAKLIIYNPFTHRLLFETSETSKKNILREKHYVISIICISQENIFFWCLWCLTRFRWVKDYKLRFPGHVGSRNWKKVRHQRETSKKHTKRQTTLIYSIMLPVSIPAPPVNNLIFDFIIYFIIYFAENHFDLHKY